MKHFIIFILFINCLFTQDEKLKISILDIDGQGIKKTSVNASFQSLETSLIESNQFIVIEKGKRDEILKEQKVIRIVTQKGKMRYLNFRF